MKKSKYKCKLEEFDSNTNKWKVIKRFKQHKWRTEYDDCHNCGGAEYKMCERCYEEKP